MHVATELARFRKPDECMDMVRDDYKPDASRLVFIENFVEPTQQNTSGMVMIQKFAPAKDGKCDEMDIQVGHQRFVG